MLIPSEYAIEYACESSLSRRVNANSQLTEELIAVLNKLIKKGEC